MPDAIVTFDPNVNFAATTLGDGGVLVTTVPSPPLLGNTFFSALGYLVPENLPGGIQNVTWSGTISTAHPAVSVRWQWAAAVYTNFNTDYNLLGVKPVDENPYLNSNHAGTPENFKSFVTGGARSGGGSNYTGSYSGTDAVGPCLARQRGPQPLTPTPRPTPTPGPRPRPTPPPHLSPVPPPSSPRHTSAPRYSMSISRTRFCCRMIST